jgi:hypothetical protein
MKTENILFFLIFVIFAYCDCQFFKIFFEKNSFCRISVNFAPILKCFTILEMAR